LWEIACVNKLKTVICIKEERAGATREDLWEVKERKKVHDFVYNCHSAFAKFHEIELEYLQNVFFFSFCDTYFPLILICR
jgi:hypothetical protein